MRHAEYAVYIDGEIIIASLSGTFDEKTAHAYCREIEQCIQHFDGRAFSCLIDGAEAIGGSPAAFNIVEKHNAWLNTQNIKAKAVIVGDEFTRQTLLKRSPSLNHDKVKFVDDKEAAYQWLKSQ